MSEKIRLGIVGLGCRGISMSGLLAERPDCVITAVCDVYPDRMDDMASKLENVTGLRPACIADYRELNRRADVDVVFVFSAWENHVPAVIDAMNAGKPAAFEVGGAYSVSDCENLIRIHERTGVPVMMLENCCYGRVEMTLTEMVRDGVFGEVIHCTGGYMHDLRSEIAGGRVNRHYRLRNYLSRNCENYPTHELGPISRILDIGHGNRFTSLVSVSSKSAGINDFVGRNPDKYDPELATARFAQGDVVTTILTTAQGQTVTLTLDTTLPRPYCRGLSIHGTRGWFEEDNRSVYTDADNTEADHFKWRKFWGNYDGYEEKYMPSLWRDYLSSGIKKGHGGMDFLVLDSFLSSIKDGDVPPLDVYDSAVLMAVTPLSAVSAASGGIPVAFPDLTAGIDSSERRVNRGKYALWK